VIRYNAFCPKPLMLVASGLLAAAILGFLMLRWRPAPLPYHDSFAANSANEWQAFGGVWEISNGTLYNRSDERGAKLITGSARWTDYRMQADLEMIGNQGDVGVIVRADQVEEGIDSYNGYYIGIRSLDSALVIGRADHGWLEGHPVAIPGGVHPAQWYRLVIVVVGCRIAAQATNLETGQSAWGAFSDQPCVHSGKIGLRSMGTGGAWRNIRVTRATEQDWLAIGSRASFIEYPEYPVSEKAYNHMREAGFASIYAPAQRYPSTTPGGNNGSDSRFVSIGELRESTWPSHNLRIRGVVTFTDPLYIQDTTGGIQLALQTPVALNLGDEIEVTGSQFNGQYPGAFVGTAVRLLWDRTPVAPLSISTTQAASGAYDSSLVEVTGYLRSKSKDSGGRITLDVSDESQVFTVVLKNALFQKEYQQWEPESWIRVVGVCVIGQSFVTRTSAFTILARSPEDIEILGGPPWWTSRRLFHLALPALLLLLLVGTFYVRLEKWKMRGILNERERLAHEMHDTLAQGFAGVGFHLQGIRNSLRSGPSSVSADLMHKLDVACELVTQTHRDASASIAALHPDADGGRDLLVALENYAIQMMGADSLPLTLVRGGTPRELSFPVRDMLFQVGREAITNVIRHSQASQIELALRYYTNSVRLEVRDNGAGFVLDENLGFGMKAMRSRCEAAGAELCIDTVPGTGTAVSVDSPYGKRPQWLDWIRSVLRRRRRLTDISTAASD
jgi:signal transduction histidine kinase